MKPKSISGCLAKVATQMPVRFPSPCYIQARQELCPTEMHIPAFLLLTKTKSQLGVSALLSLPSLTCSGQLCGTAFMALPRLLDLSQYKSGFISQLRDNIGHMGPQGNFCSRKKNEKSADGEISEIFIWFRKHKFNNRPTRAF